MFSYVNYFFSIYNRCCADKISLACNISYKSTDHSSKYRNDVMQTGMEMYIQHRTGFLYALKNVTYYYMMFVYNRAEKGNICFYELLFRSQLFTLVDLFIICQGRPLSMI